jgi:hypothetical protein
MRPCHAFGATLVLCGVAGTSRKQRAFATKRQSLN